MKPKLKWFHAHIFCAIALGTSSVAEEDSTDTASTKTSPAIPWSQLGANAGADFHGDGLGVSTSAAGARVHCIFQQLEGEATCEGLWLTSTVSDAVNDGFHVVAVN